MKYIIALFLVLPSFVFAQNCELKKSKDQFSQEPKISTGFINFPNASLTVDANTKEIDFFFSVKGAEDSKCYNDQTTITFVLDGKIKMNYKNSGTMNCEGLVHVTFRNLASTPSPLVRLSTKKVTAISISAGEKNVTTITLSPELQQLFTDKVTCLVNEAKTIIK